MEDSTRDSISSVIEFKSFSSTPTVGVSAEGAAATSLPVCSCDAAPAAFRPRLERRRLRLAGVGGAARFESLALDAVVAAAAAVDPDGVVNEDEVTGKIGEGGDDSEGGIWTDDDDVDGSGTRVVSGGDGCGAAFGVDCFLPRVVRGPGAAMGRGDMN